MININRARWLPALMGILAAFWIASPASADECPAGKVSLLGHCCWPGQDWGLTTERCIGTPQCPDWAYPSGDDCLSVYDPSPVPEYAGVVRADCSTTATSLPGDHGERYLVACPDGCGEATVWGTGVYTDDSSVCSAAIHNGMVTAEGGVFTLVVLPGRDSYQATQRHGVSSSTWARWGRSFAVVLNGAEEMVWRAAGYVVP